jgi:hypothetical protein
MASKSSGSTKTRKRAAARRRMGRLLSKAMLGMEKKLTGDNVPMTFNDCLKAMQLQKELDDEQPTEVTVTWVEPEPKKDT